MLFKREKYLSKIRPFYNADMIKVISGIRRCGKSCIMQMIRDELVESGVSDKDIIYLDLDKRANKSIKTPEQLEAKIIYRTECSAPSICECKAFMQLFL